MKNLSKFVPTIEEWYPNFPPLCYNNPLEVDAVRVVCLRISTKDWRVGVWGNDDLGFVKDYLTMDEAKTLYDSLNTPESILRSRLIKMGFEQF